jgi:hypothetical protein
MLGTGLILIGNKEKQEGVADSLTRGKNDVIKSVGGRYC